jgi:hypothetical protein
LLDVLPRPGAGAGKKLDEVACAWARGDLITQEEHDKHLAQLEEQFAVLNIELEDPTDALDEPVFDLYLWPENEPVWSLFQRCQTQWRVAGDEGVRVGLDYPGCMVVMERGQVRRRDFDDRFEELQVLEHAALRGWAEARRRERR